MCVDCIFFICSYYDAIVNLVVYGFVMLWVWIQGRYWCFVSTLLWLPLLWFACVVSTLLWLPLMWFPPSHGYHSCGFYPPVVCTLLWLPHFCCFHPPMVCTLSWLPNYVMSMLQSKLKKLWAIEYFWVLLHVLITILYDLCSVTFMSSVHVSSCVICPYRKYD